MLLLWAGLILCTSGAEPNDNQQRHLDEMLGQAGIETEHSAYSELERKTIMEALAAEEAAEEAPKPSFIGSGKWEACVRLFDDLPVRAIEIDQDLQIDQDASQIYQVTDVDPNVTHERRRRHMMIDIATTQTAATEAAPVPVPTAEMQDLIRRFATFALQNPTLFSPTWTCKSCGDTNKSTRLECNTCRRAKQQDTDQIDTSAHQPSSGSSSDARGSATTGGYPSANASTAREDLGRRVKLTAPRMVLERMIRVKDAYDLSVDPTVIFHVEKTTNNHVVPYAYDPTSRRLSAYWWNQSAETQPDPRAPGFAISADGGRWRCDLTAYDDFQTICGTPDRFHLKKVPAKTMAVSQDPADGRWRAVTKHTDGSQYWVTKVSLDINGPAIHVFGIRCNSQGQTVQENVPISNEMKQLFTLYRMFTMSG